MLLFDLTPGALAAGVADCQAECTSMWHDTEGRLRDGETTPKSTAAGSFFERACLQHRRNTQLWHEEDKARVVGAPDAVIANVKRRIDKLNQQRNDLIETLDEALAAELAQGPKPPAEETPWNSETPGSIIDRMSIMSLKAFHTEVQTRRTDVDDAHRLEAKRRLAILQLQRQDLTTALARLLEALAEGRFQMKLYRQFKMYNDPAWNPLLAKSRNSAQT